MSKPYDVALVCGRFQHFHAGHESLVDTALLLADRVLILLGSAQESGTLRNPFDVITRAEIIKEIYGDKVLVKPIVDLTNEGDITPEWGKYVLEHCNRYIHKKPDIMVYGNDESRSLWFDKEDISDVTEIIINRDKLPISATVKRTFLKNDMREEWMKYANPKIHKHYDWLRAELMAVKSYHELSK